MIRSRVVKRPTYREIEKRLKEAKEALEAEPRRAKFANPNKCKGEQIEPGLILKLIKGEIRPGHYKGAYPPLKSYESAIKNCDLWPFSWDSDRLERRMYLKFAIKDGNFYYVSLHEDKPSKDGKKKL